MNMPLSKLIAELWTRVWGKVLVASMIALILGLLLAAENQSKNYRGNDEASNKQGQQKPDESFWAPSTWAPITVFTAALAIVGGFQVFAACGTILVLIKQSRILGKQTAIQERQAETLPNLERAYVYVTISEPGVRIVNGPTGNALLFTETTLQIDNVGRTPARLTRIHYQFDTVPGGNIIDFVDPHMIGGRELPVGTIAVQGTSYTENERLRGQLSESHNAIMFGRRSIWVTGFVRYADIFEENYITVFTLCFDPIGERFVRRGNNQRYNYAQKELPSDIPEPSG